MAAPLTRTRLKGIVTLQVLKDDAAGLADRSSPVPTDSNAYMAIGAATKITITETRENNSRYELTGDYTAFEPAETYPGKVSYEVTLDRVDLYDANLLEAFDIQGVNHAGSRSNILNQLKPLTIFVTQPAPVDGDGQETGIPGKTFTARMLIIPGCWLNNYTTEYEIDADQKYVQSITMIARTVIAA